jgi:uncharacterized membrane protein YuzA (DUF378 family)
VAIFLEWGVAGFMWRFIINRYCTVMESVHNTGRKSLQEEAVSRLEQSTLLAGSTAPACMRVIVIVCGLFWGLITLDMVADIYGNNAGIGTFVGVFVGLPLCNYLAEVVASHSSSWHSICSIRSNGGTTAPAKASISRRQFEDNVHDEFRVESGNRGAHPVVSPLFATKA